MSLILFFNQTIRFKAHFCGKIVFRRSFNYNKNAQNVKAGFFLILERLMIKFGGGIYQYIIFKDGLVQPFESFLPYYFRKCRLSQFDSVTQSVKAKVEKLNINNGKYS